MNIIQYVIAIIMNLLYIEQNKYIINANDSMFSDKYIDILLYNLSKLDMTLIVTRMMQFTYILIIIITCCHIIFNFIKYNFY